MDDGMRDAARPRAWPFAITRSVNTGFRIVVAPDFLVDADKQSLLHDVADGEADVNAVYVREYRGGDFQRLWLLYRVVYLKGADVGLDGEYAMSGPRRTPLIEGVVCRERPERPAALATEELFADIHRTCGTAVRVFFKADLGDYPVNRSQELTPPDVGLRMPTSEREPYVAGRSTVTAPCGRRPTGRPRRYSAAALRSAVFSALGRIRSTAPVGDAGIHLHGHGRRSPGMGRPQNGSKAQRSGQSRPGRPRGSLGRRLVRAAAVIVFAVLAVFVFRKLW